MTTSRWRRTAAGLTAATLIPLGVAVTGGAAAAADPPQACAHRVPSDFNGDGYADIAAGEPRRAVGGVEEAGAVRVVYGGASGVATTGSDQYFDQNTGAIAGVPDQGGDFGYAVAAGYFNGDCFADLAIGTPGENDVTILYGSAAGLTTTGTIQLTGSPSGSAFGTALTSGDFNADGFGDLAIGEPAASDGGMTDSGAVGIWYGSSAGTDPTVKFYGQNTAGVPGTPETDDEFGLTVVAGDFNGDGAADVAIGAPYENNGSVVDGGSVAILLGHGGTGITTTGSQLWTQSSTGVPGTDETDDNFGAALAAGDVNGDGRSDLIVGAPGEAVGTAAGAGAVWYLPGSAAGVTGTGSKSWSQNTGAVPGTAEGGDGFGVAVTTGDFNGDGRADVAIGAPFEGLGTTSFAGDVTILPGTTGGPTDTGSKEWDQGVTGVLGAVEADDLFGFSLYAAGITSKTHADLVIGVPDESTGTTAGNGALNILRGSSSGLTATGNQYFGEPADTGGATADGDFFGYAIG